MAHSNSQNELTGVSALAGNGERGITNEVNTSASAGGLATRSDVEQVIRAVVPPAVDKNPRRGLADPFTIEVMRVLTSPAVLGYVGTRVKMEELVAAAVRFGEYDRLRARLENSANVAAQISAPDGLLVEEELGKFMLTWADFEAQHPKEALTLAALRESWSSAHPGRRAARKERASKKSKEEATQKEEAAPATPAEKPKA